MVRHSLVPWLASLLALAPLVGATMPECQNAATATLGRCKAQEKGQSLLQKGIVDMGKALVNDEAKEAAEFLSVSDLEKHCEQNHRLQEPNACNDARCCHWGDDEGTTKCMASLECLP